MGFSSVTGEETIMFADNCSFDGTPRGGAMNANGQLWIGSAGSPSVVVGTLTAGSGISISNGPGSITLSASGTSALSFPTDSGTAVPASNELTLHGTHGLNTSGSGATVTTAINNSITLGDLSTISTGSNALSATTGDINITAGNLKLPNTTASDASGEIQFGGNRFISNYGTGNTFVGQTAGNTSLINNDNTGIGKNALNALTTGYDNTCVGSGAGASITTNLYNTAVGAGALENGNADRCVAIGYTALGQCEGSGNVAVGTAAAQSLTSGGQTVAIGYLALSSGTGSANTALGFQSCYSVTTGGNNTGLGGNSLLFVQTGNYNIGIGYNGGASYTTSESNNIAIGSSGTAGESNVIRLGTQGTQTTAFIAGITGTTVSNQQLVTINSSTGQLGTTTASTVVWTDVSGTSATMSPNNGYGADNASLVTLTLPTTAAQYSLLSIQGVGAGGWTIVQNSGQKIVWGSISTTVTTGSVSSNTRYDSVDLICIVANTTWAVRTSSGTLTIV